MPFPRASFVLAASALLLGACPDDSKLPIGASCSSDGTCASGYCIASLCLDPNADDDGDGLINSIEGALGTNPQNADTDGDGVSDYDEVVNASNPQDTDADGKSDAVESILSDIDQDCIVDQLDAKDEEPETDPVVLAGFVCLHDGACGAGGAVVSATCTLEGDKRVHHCDYSQVPGYEATEAGCDEIDNDCNGLTDEPFTAGGTVTYTDDDGTAGKVKGAPCGIGACSGGVVVCQDASTLTCSTKGSGVAEVCDGVDNDCDGATDESFAAGGTVTFDGGAYAPDAGKVLGAACGTGACAGGSVVCAPDDNSALACSTAGNASAEACGDSVDNDCEGTTDQGSDLVSCTPFFYDGDSDDYGVSGDSQCTCVSSGFYTATASGDCDDLDGDRNPGAAPICGADADCDDHLLDAGEACDDGDDEFYGDGCMACEITETQLVAPEPRSRDDVNVAAFSGGGFAVGWRDNYLFVFAGLAGTGIAFGFYDDAGAEVGSFTLEDNATVARYSPRLVTLSTGDVFAAWVEALTQEGRYSIQGVRLNAVGEPQGAISRLDDVDYDYLDYNFDLAALDAGGFVVGWLGESYLSYTYEPRVRAFDGSDAPRFASVVATSGGYLEQVAVIGFADGTFLAGWLKQDLELYNRAAELRRFAANGDPVGDVFSGVGVAGPNDVRAWALSGFAGGAFTTFYVYDTGDYIFGLARQDFAADGGADGAESFVIAADGRDMPYRFEAAGLLDGTMAIAYAGYGQGETSMPATLWHIPSSGAATEVILENAELLPSSSATGLAAAPTGPFLAAWPAYDGGSAGLYYQRVNADGSKRYH